MPHSPGEVLPAAHLPTVWQAPASVLGVRPLLPRSGQDSQAALCARAMMYYAQLQELPRRLRRAVQRRWRLPLARVALMLALGWSPAQAATLQVDANCTLVDAIVAANTDTATGGCPAGDGADTIALPAGLWSRRSFSQSQ